MKRRKFNVVDVVIVILVALLLVFGCYKLLTRGSGGAGDKVNITYTVKVSGQDPAVLESVKRYMPGKLMASGEKVEGTVTQVTSQPSTVYVYATNTGGTAALLPTENDQLLDLIFTIEAVVDAPASEDEAQLTQVGTQEVRIGRSHIVKTEHFELVGNIIDVTWSEK